MKHLNIVVFVVVGAAVLVAAYAIGLLVRQTRMPDVELPSQEVAEPNTVPSQDAVAASRRASRRPEEPTEEERAAARHARAEQLAKMKTLTEEEKQQFRDKIRQQFTAGADKQRQALPTPIRQKPQGTQTTTVNVNEPSQGDAAGERAAEEETSEPNTIDQN